MLELENQVYLFRLLEEVESYLDFGFGKLVLDVEQRLFELKPEIDFLEGGA